MAKRIRLDQALVQRGMFESRRQAQTAIMAGEVRIDGRTAAKPSDFVQEHNEISVVGPARYVGRGGIKLEGAIDLWWPAECREQRARSRSGERSQ